MEKRNSYTAMGLFLVLLVAALGRDLLKVAEGSPSLAWLSVFHLVVIVLLYGYAIGMLVGSMRYPLFRPSQDRTIFLFFLWCFTLFLWKGINPESVLYMGWLFFGFGTAYLTREIVVNLDFHGVLYASSLICILIIAIALLEIFTATHLPASKQALNLGSNVPTATFWNQNDFAFYIVLFFPFLFSLLKLGFSRFAIFLMVLFVLVMTQSTAAVAALALWGLVYTILSRQYLTLLIGFFFGLIFLALFPDWLFSNPDFIKIYSFITMDAESNEGGRSAGIRLTLLWTVWDEFARNGNWLSGLGPGGVRRVLAESGSDILTMHNFVIEILFNFGVIIWLGFMWVWIISVRRFVRFSHSDAVVLPERRAALPIASSLIILPIASLGPAFVTYVTPFWVWVGILAGLSVRLRLTPCWGCVSRDTAAQMS